MLCPGLGGQEETQTCEGIVLNREEVYTPRTKSLAERTRVVARHEQACFRSLLARIIAEMYLNQLDPRLSQRHLRSSKSNQKQRRIRPCDLCCNEICTPSLSDAT